jgi:hypothetical protein
MTFTKTVSVNAEEQRTTFEFVSFGAPLEHSAYICVEREKYTVTRSRLGWRKKTSRKTSKPPTATSIARFRIRTIVPACRAHAATP